jgi:predicted AAA+ superfamily ATPase
MVTNLEFNYYRTIDKSEVDIIVESSFGVIPTEIKLCSLIKRKSLRSLVTFMKDRQCPYGIVINRAQKIELITDRIVQIPVHYIQH